ncbi:cell division ATP-binding protein FtsE [Priestia taiwanensis]|uniref:Cell division ATP-binding protein FtsE n=1 Tax=Priestia taiwanensis TaxID=1347902 RepID=A0A917AYM4_9BACI|nr:cell division ATP-binding protein FtsE [Priestia taiwanensis]MBM7364399.1 cell division transport system ATP-binding protein [Priestia taiwanensis]GGE81699.1 cell division ATP-binding protein FtsE [Priestia taiwanensis]
MIEMREVHKTYPNGVRALNGINIKIQKGEFVYVVGPSGAGKSTFIKMMYREEKPTTGLMLVNGMNVGTIKDTEVPMFRRNLGVIFQDFKLLPTLTVYENVAFAMEVIEEEPEVIQKRVMDVLNQVKIGHKANMKPNELSGGEQQRVAIARAIVNRPKVLIADEPTGNLDPETTWGIMDILKEISDTGTTIIMATHNREIVNTIKKRVIAIEKGRIVRDEARGEYGYED